MNTTQEWYKVENEQSLDTPSILIFKDRIQHNILEMLRITGSVDRLMPHVKTYKMKEVVQMQLAVGIQKFKAATIAEAEMTAMAGAKFVLIAHQLVGAKLDRLVLLCQKYPQVHFASLIDCEEVAQELNDTFAKHGLTAHIFIDVNNAMNRSGLEVENGLLDFYKTLAQRTRFPALHCEGLHIYDGNFRQTDFQNRKEAIDTAFAPIYQVLKDIKNTNLPVPMLVCGGTPAFTVHAQREQVFCSPGTCLISDWGYGETLTEQNFEWAGVLLTRIISKPKQGYVTLDLGHKAVASENPLDKRIKFLNLSDYQFISQSEEHLVLEVKDWQSLKVGQVLYGIPYHICPTINLYNEVYVVENHNVNEVWQVIARNRKITV